jgi:hypothetical protein
MEGDEFYVNVRWEGNHSPSPKIVNVRIWADIDYDNQMDDGEMYATQTAMPNGFARNRWRALDDGPWPGNTTSVDPLPVHVSVDYGDWQTTGAPVHNVKPMFEEPPKYKFGVDDAGRDYVEVEVDFWDPGIKDLFKLTLETSGSGSSQPRSYSSDWMPADSKGDILNYIKYRFYTDRLYDLGDRFTLTVADDDSGLDRRWNLWQAVEHNDNDSNLNSVVDLLERNLPSADPDIVELGGRGTTRTNWLETDAELSVRYDQSAQRPLMLSPDGELVLFYDPSVIRIWDSPKKEKLFAPYGGIPGEIGHRFTGRETLWIEGYNKGSTEVYATWTPNTPGYFVNEYMNRLVSHSFTVNVAGIDVDIDSDNDDGMQANFERDAWNEYLEDSPYALGKLIGQNTRSNLIAKDGFVPMVIDVSGLSPNLRSHLTFSWQDSRFELWRSDQTVLEPDRIFNGEPTSLQNFVKDDKGLITVWISRFSEVELVKEVDPLPPPDAIKVTLDCTDLQMSDAVQIRPAWHKNANMFARDAAGEYPPALQDKPAVRSAGAAKLVYDDLSDSKYALKKLDAAEVEKLLRMDPFYSEENLKNEDRQGNLNDLIRYLTEDQEGAPRVRVFLDHCDTAETKSPVDGGGRYIISFRGTVHNPSDWISNIGQAWDGTSPYHEVALRIGNYLQDVTAFRYDFAGHSLGGGLAAAAALNSNREANTFNAAGLNPKIFVRVGSDRPKEYVKYGKTNYETPGRREALITAHLVEDSVPDGSGFSDCPDVLTWLQWTIKSVSGHGFEADGKRVQMEGLLNLVAAERMLLKDITKLFANYWSGITLADQKWETIWTAIEAGYSYFGGFSNKLVKAHGFPHLFYGLLHDDELGWNAYDHDWQR